MTNRIVQQGFYSTRLILGSLKALEKWCRLKDLNPQPTDYKSVLPKSKYTTANNNLTNLVCTILKPVASKLSNCLIKIRKTTIVQICVLVPLLSACSHISTKDSNSNLSYQDIVDAQTHCQKFQYKTDMENYDVSDHWATPAEMEAKGAGDCEDFAICKKAFLAKRGFKPEQMTLLDGCSKISNPECALFGHGVAKFSKNLGHAVLEVKLNGQTYILDNERGKPVNKSDYQDFITTKRVEVL